MGHTTAHEQPYLVVLGIAQDAGYPAAGCKRDCCTRAWAAAALRRHVSCLGLIDPQSGGRWLLDCTPDFPAQLHALDQLAPVAQRPGLSGILLTHAHIGHYAGLIHLGREALAAHGVPVYAMPRMREYLRNNGPWSQLIESGNLTLQALADRRQQSLNSRLSVTPLTVPHRDEYSETVGFIIEGPLRTVIYLPDIDKWERWQPAIEDVISSVDAAYLDGTFFADGELGGRDMAEIAHPYIAESIDRFAVLPASERTKIRFTHFNHTNPVVDPHGEAARRVRIAGHHLAEEGEIIQL